MALAHGHTRCSERPHWLCEDKVGDIKAEGGTECGLVGYSLYSMLHELHVSLWLR